jgi:pyrroline-5-carboxylate reductase
MKKLGFIGGGNMARAILGGVLKAGLYAPSDVYVSDASEKALETCAEFGVHTSIDNKTVLAADAVVLAVKPFALPAVLKEISECDAKGKTFISIAAGVPIAAMKAALGAGAKVIRVMPNTPALVGEGLTVVAEETAPCTPEEVRAAVQIFEAVGKVRFLPESLLNSVIALSSSSPAYIFMLIEAMADGGVRDGVPRALAYEIAAQAVLGSAKMVLETGNHPGELKDMVCSPKGTTIEAVKVLEEKGFRGAVLAAMEACTKKADKNLYS